MIIYRVLNTINGKSYIGLTTLSLGERKHKHWLNSRNPEKNKRQALYLAINKYGWDSFEWQEVTADGKYEPSIGENVVDMGLRGLIPLYVN